MKKRFFTCLFVLLMVVGITEPVFSDSFVPSIAQRHEVYIEGGTMNPNGSSSLLFQEEDDCWTEIVVTPYAYKDTIESDNSRYLIDIAYGEIIKIPTVYDLDPAELEVIIEETKLEKNDLVVRDLFDITKYHRGTSEGHDENFHSKYIEITLGTQTLHNYVCLLHYKGGEWHIVPSAYVLKDECHLYLSVDELSPFAIVVHTEERNQEPINDGCGCIWHWFILITLLITFVVCQFVRRDEEEDDEDDLELKARDIEGYNTQKEEELKKMNRRVRIRDILSVINLILCIIFYILGFCKWDIYALILDVIIVVIIFLYSHPRNKNEDEE